MRNYPKLRGPIETPGPSGSLADRKLKVLAEIVPLFNNLVIDFNQLAEELERRNAARSVVLRAAAVSLSLSAMQQRLCQLQVLGLQEMVE